jgi:putative ABC transport system permease protein
MFSLRNIVSGVRALFRREQVEREMDEELRGFLEMAVEEKVQQGMSREEALRAVRLERGSPEATKEVVRSAGWESFVDTCWRDLRFGLRMLRHNAGVTATVALTLALGIGVNTAMFSVLNGWLLRPLPVPSPEQITVLAAEQKEGSNGNFSYPDFLDFQKATDSFSSLFGYAWGIGGLSANGDAREIGYVAVTGNYFSGLGVKPTLGRLFLPSESEKPGEELLVVLGYSFWQSKVGGDPQVIGKSVRVNGKQATVIGVTPRDFHGTTFAFDMDAYLPLSALTLGGVDSGNPWTARADRRLTVMGRLKPGTTLEQAQSSADVIADRLAAQYPDTDKGVKVRVIPERFARPAAFVATFVPAIASLFLVLAGLVLLLACTNVTNILLVRATARSREVAIRSALGASRGRIVRQIVTESLLMALLGSAGGVLLGAAALAVSGSLLHSVFTNSNNYSLTMDVSLDWRVFAYATGTAILSGILVGLWPALRAARTDVNVELQEGSRGASPSGRKAIVRSVLTAAQLACSLMLLIAAGLFVRSLNSTEHMYLGFNPDHILNVVMDPNEIGYDQAQTKAFYEDLANEVGRIPGVESTSVAFTVPMARPSNTAPVFVKTHPISAHEPAPLIPYDCISPSYLQTMQVPLRQGRQFTESDNEKAQPVAIINQTMAKRFWPNENPIGKYFGMKGDAGPFVEVVGVAGDGQYFFISTAAYSYFYVPLAQNFVSYRMLQLRTSVPPLTLVKSVEEQVHKLAPDLPIDDIRTMPQLVQGLGGLFVFRLAATVAAAMGILGLVLAIVGVYGVVSYSAGQRTHEIGIRVALGAGSHDILKLISAQGLRLVGFGVGVGLLAAWVLSRAMKSLLVGVNAADPLTFASVAILLGFVALAACVVPAHRATLVDPMIALRYE